MRGQGEGSVFKDNGTGLWTGIVELPGRDGKRRRKTIRRKNKRDLLDALSAEKEALKQRGDLPTKGQTAEQWFAYWLRLVAKEVRPNTYDGYMRSVNNHIVPEIGKVKLDKLTAAHVRRVHDSILEKKLSSTTALLAHRIMSASFKIAVREGRMHRNPAELTNAPRKAVVHREAFDVGEALKVSRACCERRPDGRTVGDSIAHRGSPWGSDRPRS